MTQIITFAGRKGGITKTTLTINVGAALAMRGHRVVIVETDGQGSAARLMGIKPYDGFYSIVEDDAEFADVIVKAPKEFAGDVELYFLGSSDAQLEIENSRNVPTAIYNRFQELRGWADFVLVDTSPAINEINSAFMYTSDWLILPTLCERPSIDMLQTKTLVYLENVREIAAEAGLPAAQVLGIVPNRFDAREAGSRVSVGFLQGKYGDKYQVFEIIRNLAVWGKAAIQRTSVPLMTEVDDYNTIRQARAAIGELMPIVHSIEALEKAQVTA